MPSKRKVTTWKKALNIGFSMTETKIKEREKRSHHKEPSSLTMPYSP